MLSQIPCLKDFYYHQRQHLNPYLFCNRKGATPRPIHHQILLALILLRAKQDFVHLFSLLWTFIELAMMVAQYAILQLCLVCGVLFLTQYWVISSAKMHFSFEYEVQFLKKCFISQICQNGMTKKTGVSFAKRFNYNANFLFSIINKPVTNSAL